MPSTKKNKSEAGAPVAPALGAVDSVSRIDIMGALEVGAPTLEPVPATFLGVDFSIKRHFTAEAVWEWTRLQQGDPKAMSIAEVDKKNRAILKIVIVEEDHDKIDDLRTKVEALPVEVARRIWIYIYLQAGLVDERGNPLAL